MSDVFRGRPLGVKINGTFICITKWSITGDADKQEVTNSCTPGDGKEHTQGSGADSGTFEGFVKSNQNMHLTPFLITKGTVVTAKFYYDKADEATGYSGSIFIDSFTVNDDIKGNPIFTVAWTAEGDLVLPTYT